MKLKIPSLVPALISLPSFLPRDEVIMLNLLLIIPVFCFYTLTTYIHIHKQHYIFLHVPIFISLGLVHFL